MSIIILLILWLIEIRIILLDLDYLDFIKGLIYLALVKSFISIILDKIVILIGCFIDWLIIFIPDLRHTVFIQILLTILIYQFSPAYAFIHPLSFFNLEQIWFGLFKPFHSHTDIIECFIHICFGFSDVSPMWAVSGTVWICEICTLIDSKVISCQR